MTTSYTLLMHVEVPGSEDEAPVHLLALYRRIAALPLSQQLRLRIDEPVKITDTQDTP